MRNRAIPGSVVHAPLGDCCGAIAIAGELFSRRRSPKTKQRAARNGGVARGSAARNVLGDP